MHQARRKNLNENSIPVTQGRSKAKLHKAAEVHLPADVEKQIRERMKKKYLSRSRKNLNENSIPVTQGRSKAKLHKAAEVHLPADVEKQIRERMKKKCLSRLSCPWIHGVLGPKIGHSGRRVR